MILRREKGGVGGNGKKSLFGVGAGNHLLLNPHTSLPYPRGSHLQPPKRSILNYNFRHLNHQHSTCWSSQIKWQGSAWVTPGKTKVELLSGWATEGGNFDPCPAHCLGSIHSPPCKSKQWSHKYKSERLNINILPFPLSSRPPKCWYTDQSQKIDETIEILISYQTEQLSKALHLLAQR